MEEKYIISKIRLLKLLEKENELRALKNSGVDNWEWYEEAFEEFDEEYPEKELKKFERYDGDAA